MTPKLDAGSIVLIHSTLLRNVILALAALSCADALLGLLSTLFFPVGFFANKTMPRIASDLAFLEGATIFLSGAVLAFMNNKLSLNAKTLMIVGPAMIGVSLLLGALG